MPTVTIRWIDTTEYVATVELPRDVDPHDVATMPTHDLIDLATELLDRSHRNRWDVENCHDRNILSVSDVEFDDEDDELFGETLTTNWLADRKAQ